MISMSHYVSLNKFLSYSYLNLYNDQINNKIYFNLLFDVGKSIEIENRNGKPIKTNNIFIVNLVCIISLESSNNNIKREFVFHRDFKQTYLTFGSNILFNYELTEFRLEELINWRNGGNVTIKWNFYGNGLTEENNKILLINFTNSFESGFIFPQMTQNEWNSIIKQANLDKKFIREYSLSLPSSFNNKNNPFLKQIFLDLNTMAIKLNEAKDRLRKSNDTSDYKAVMGDVKSSLDSIKNFTISQTNAEQFLVKTNTFADTDLNGGLMAATEVLGRIKNIMEHTYKISSKPVHTTLEKSNIKFTMNPSSEDALFVFELSLSMLNYFIEKFKKLG